jgi:2-polyprenyl-3-methyl-5-hydroxy-6-metoxy-1,4-benzoquinol methylase
MMHNPQAILAPYVREGMTVLDFGSAMGFFSLPLAHMVGPDGKVICLDMQEGMLKRLEKRVQRAGMAARMEIRLSQQTSLGLGEYGGKIDFVLAFAVVHEVPDHPRLFRELAALVKPEGRLLVAEPKGHVSEDELARTVSVAQQQGFCVVDRPQVRRCRAVLLKKTQ